MAWRKIDDVIRSRAPLALPLPLLLAVPLLAALLVFGHVRDQSFVSWDDNLHVYQNPYLAVADGRDLGHFWRHPYQELYVPLPYTFWYGLSAFATASPPPGTPASERQPFNPAAFHLANLLLHLLNTVSVFFLLRFLLRHYNAGRAVQPYGDAATGLHKRLDDNAAGIGACAGALLWAIHPLQVESVAWVSEARGLLCALFALPALGLYLWAADESHVARQRRLVYAMALSCFVLALLAKPTATALPLVALALEFTVLRHTVAAALRRLWPWLALATAWVLVTRYAQPTGSSGIVSALWTRPLVAGDALAFYLGKLLYPANLAADYGRTPAALLSHRWGYCSWLVPVLVGFLGWWAAKKAPIVWPALLLWVVSLLPVLGFVTFIFQGYSTVADRYVYMGMMGPALLLGYVAMRAAYRGGRSGEAMLALCFAYPLLLMPLTSWQTRVWDNTYALTTNTIAVNPRSTMGHVLLGNYYDARHQDTAAMQQYRETLQAKPTDFVAMDTLAALMEKHGAPQAQVLPMYRKAVALKPDYSPALTNLGRVYLAQGHSAMAMSLLRRAVAANPAYSLAHWQLGMALGQSGQMAAAVPEFQEALRLEPDDQRATANLGLALAELGQNDEAIPYLQSASAAAPQNNALHTALGKALAKTRHLPEAIVQLRLVAEALPRDAAAHYNLGLALLMQGDKSAAAAQLAQAVRLDPKNSEAQGALKAAQTKQALPGTGSRALTR